MVYISGKIFKNEKAKVGLKQNRVIMAQDYDKIIKENIEDVFLSLSRKLMGLEPRKFEEIPNELQRTIERKPDFLKKVVESKEGSYILHIEFQTANDPDMVYRMNEYAAMLLRKYKLEVKQAVFFIGHQPMQMENQLQVGQVSFSYNLFNLAHVSYKEFIVSEQPEEVILSILGDFGEESPQKVVRAILRRIKDLTKDSLNRERYLKQLEILSGIRKLQKLVTKIVSSMAFTYDMENDIRFKQGEARGEARGETKGKVTSLLLYTEMTVEEIAVKTGVDINYVEGLAQELRK